MPLLNNKRERKGPLHSQETWPALQQLEILKQTQNTNSHQAFIAEYWEALRKQQEPKPHELCLFDWSRPDNYCFRTVHE